MTGLLLSVCCCPPLVVFLLLALLVHLLSSAWCCLRAAAPGAVRLLLSAWCCCAWCCCACCRPPAAVCLLLSACCCAQWDWLSVTHCLLSEVATTAAFFVSFWFWVGLVAIAGEFFRANGGTLMAHAGNLVLALCVVLLTRLPLVSTHFQVCVGANWLRVEA